MKVYIVGSCPDQLQLPAFTDACKELGERLAESGHRIVIGSENEATADRWVIEGANSHKGRSPTAVSIYRISPSGKKPFSGLHASYQNLRFDWPAGSSIWPSMHTRAVRESDAVVVVGGRKGSHVSAVVASMLGRRVIPVSAFGGAGEELYIQVRESLIKGGLDEDTVNALNRPNWDAEVLSAVMKGLNVEIRKPRTFDAELIDTASLSLGRLIVGLPIGQLVGVGASIVAAAVGIFALGQALPPLAGERAIPASQLTACEASLETCNASLKQLQTVASADDPKNGIVKRVAYTELLRSLQTLMEPFSLLVGKQRGITLTVTPNTHNPATGKDDGKIIQREIGRYADPSKDEFQWMLDTIEKAKSEKFIDSLQGTAAIERPDQLLTPKGQIWATYLAGSTASAEQKMTDAINQFSRFYDADTLALVSQLKGHRFSQILRSLPGNIQMNIEQGNGRKLDKFTLYLGFMGPYEPKEYYLPYLDLVQKAVELSRDAILTPVSGDPKP